MSQKSFNLAASVIFFAVFILHILRLFYGWEAVIGGLAIPTWASYVALVIAAGLSYSAISLARKG